MVRVKICGITNQADAEHAIASGADAIGFVFAKSPRKISPAAAKKIISTLGPWVTTVGVFVDESPAVIRRIAARCGLDAVQLHGSESPAETKKLKPLTVIKSFRVGKSFNAASAGRWEADAFLFDTQAAGMMGGTGKTFDWRLVKRKFFRPVILSGGLNPRNVARAVRLVRPYGVDVSSGVEKFPGKKDSKLMKEFIRNAKEA